MKRQIPVRNRNGSTGSPTVGIYTGVLTGGRRIENDSVFSNLGCGILARSGDLIVRNGAGKNTSGNDSPSSGANFAPGQPPKTTTSPWANSSF